MRHLQEIYTKYRDQGLVVLGFNTTDQKQIALEFLRESGATFPTILDSSEAAKKVGEDMPASLPGSYVIGRDGLIVAAWGVDEEGDPNLIAALKKTGGQLAETIRREMQTKVEQSADEVAAAAGRLFDAIRTADYDHPWLGTIDWKHFPAKDARYDPAVYNRAEWVRSVCTKFKVNPITEVRLGKVFANEGGLPTLHFELQLKDGEVVQGDLPFKWDSEGKQWIGWKGLDWHLQKSP